MSTRSDALSSDAAAAAVGAPPRSPANLALFVGLGALVAAFALMMAGNAADPARPFLGWMLGSAFWVSALIGMLFFLMLSWMFDAGWSVIIRRQIEHFIGAFPLLFLAMLPLALISILNRDGGLVAWIWMQPDTHVPGGHGTVGGDVLYAAKAPYLNHAFFIGRFVVVFAIWAGLAYLFRRWSFRMDDTGDHSNVHASRKLAAGGLVLCALATTLASIDWFKSLNYHWFSTMYGVWFFAASMRAGFATLVLALFYLARRKDSLKGIINQSHFYLLGCLMLAFTIFWAYISFCQYFLIYNANIPEETFWYSMREVFSNGAKNSWWYVSLALIFCHFFVPFLWLLWYRNKFGARLAFISVWILVFHLLDLYWNILPQKFNSAESASGYIVRQFSVGFVDILTFIGVGGLVIWFFLRSVASHRPIPVRDPRILESLNTHE